MRRDDLRDVAVGQRVTIRHRLPDGRPTDAVGHLISHGAHEVTLRTRRGEVRVPYDAVVVYRVVSTGPWRIGSFLRRARIAVLGIDCLLRVPGADGSPEERSRPTATAALVEELTGAGVPVLILTDDDRGAQALTDVGLPQLAPLVLTLAGDATSASGGWHAALEARLGRSVSPAQVHFTDPRPARVELAREQGWQARTFTPLA